MPTRRPWSSLSLLVALAALLAACSSAPPPFAASTVSPATGGAGDLLTVGTLRGGATGVLEVCGEVLDTTYVEGAYTFDGRSYTGRLTAAAPLFLPGADCDVVARLGTATADAGTFEYTASPVAGRSVLMYLSLGTSAVAAGDAAVQALIDTGVDVTRVGSSAAFVTELTGGEFDVVAWIEESAANLSVGVVDAIADHVAAGGTAVFSYYGLYDASVPGVPQARAALGIAGVSNVTPVSGGTIDAALQGSLALGLPSSTVTLFNDGVYGLAYAARLELAAFSSSTCTFTDATGGSCAVLANAQRSLVLGVTLGTLHAGEGATAVRRLLENALITVELP